jgi:cytochrome P450 family 135
MGGMDLPPGPREPAALQTVEWFARPTAFLRRCRARHGDPFTVRVAWADAPMVLVADPDEIRRIFAADDGQLHGGASSTVLEPFAGPTSILLTHGPDHLRRRRELLPAFHGEALAGWRETVAAMARAEVARWPAGELRTLPRMQALTLDVILRVVLGPVERPQLRAAIRRALDMTASLPRLVAMSLYRGTTWNAFLEAVAEVDALLARAIDRGGHADGSLLSVLSAAGIGREELRDQVVTVLAAGHETTAGSLAWALERLAHHLRAQERVRDGDDAYLDAVVKEVLRVRPVLSIAARRVAAPFEVGGFTLPAGVHVAPCIYLAHRRTEAWPEPTAFRPERFLDATPAPGTYLPFGGGVRRCAGAAFAALELREVLRAVLARFALATPGARTERMIRGSVTLRPSRGGKVLTEPLQPSRPCRSSAATTA